MNKNKKKNNELLNLNEPITKNVIMPILIREMPEEEYQNLKNELMNLRRENSELMKKFMSITNDAMLLQETINQNKILLNENEQLKTLNENLKNKIKELENDNKNLNIKICELENDNKNLNIKIYELENNAKSNTIEIENLTNENNKRRMNNIYKKIECAIQDLNKEYDLEKKHIHSKLNKLRSDRNENNHYLFKDLKIDEKNYRIKKLYDILYKVLKNDEYNIVLNKYNKKYPKLLESIKTYLNENENAFTYDVNKLDDDAIDNTEDWWDEYN